MTGFHVFVMILCLCMGLIAIVVSIQNQVFRHKLKSANKKLSNKEIVIQEQLRLFFAQVQKLYDQLKQKTANNKDRTCIAIEIPTTETYALQRPIEHYMDFLASYVDNFFANNPLSEPVSHYELCSEITETKWSRKHKEVKKFSLKDKSWHKALDLLEKYLHANIEFLDHYIIGLTVKVHYTQKLNTNVELVEKPVFLPVLSEKFLHDYIDLLSLQTDNPVDTKLAQKLQQIH